MAKSEAEEKISILQWSDKNYDFEGYEQLPKKSFIAPGQEVATIIRCQNSTECQEILFVCHGQYNSQC